MSRFLSFFLAGELLPSVCPSVQLELAFLSGLIPEGLTESRSSLLPSRPRLCTLPVMMDACRARGQCHSAESAAGRDGTTRPLKCHRQHGGTTALINQKISTKKLFLLAVRAIPRPREPASRSMAESLCALHPHPNRELNLRRKHLWSTALFFHDPFYTNRARQASSCAWTILIVKEDKYITLRKLPEEPVSAWVSSLPLQTAAPLQHHTVLAMAQGSQCLGLHWSQFSTKIGVLSISK